MKSTLPLIKAVLIDIDGCLSPKEFGEPLDLEPLLELQRLGKKAAKDPSIPKFIINTGRDFNYAELMGKILAGCDYYIFEMGAACIASTGAQLKNFCDPSISDVLLEEKDIIIQDFLQVYPHYHEYFQMGKLYMDTFLFKLDSPVKKQCLDDLQRFFKEKGSQLVLDEGKNFINIIFPNIHKGTGLDLFLGQFPEFSKEEIAGIGDSDGDWDFLQSCAFSGCPANSSQKLKDRCDYVASKPEAAGTLLIVKHIIQMNTLKLAQLRRSNYSNLELTHPIKAIILDINGTLSPKSFGESIDLEVLEEIRALTESGSPHGESSNRNAEEQGPQNKPMDPIMLCLNTGRSLNHTALFAQLLNIRTHSIYEMGASLVSIQGSNLDVIPHPALPADAIQRMTKLKQKFLAAYPQYQNYLVFGKKYMFTFQFELDSIIKDNCAADFTAFLSKNGFSDQYDAIIGANFINIVFRGMTKGAGLQLFLQKYPHLTPQNLLGIGDNLRDLDYMDLCAVKACPADADLDMRDRCDYVATHSGIAGTLEILRIIIQKNQNFA